MKRLARKITERLRTSAESPHEKGVIWTGSDDGFVQLTRDGGATWKNVTPNGLAECLINAIEVSPFDKANGIYRDDPLSSSTITGPACTKPPTMEIPGRRSTTASPQMRLPASSGKMKCEKICCLPARNLASLFRGMAATTGRRFN